MRNMINLTDEYRRDVKIRQLRYRIMKTASEIMDMLDNIFMDIKNLEYVGDPHVEELKQIILEVRLKTEKLYNMVVEK